MILKILFKILEGAWCPGGCWSGSHEQVDVGCRNNPAQFRVLDDYWHQSRTARDEQQDMVLREH